MRSHTPRQQFRGFYISDFHPTEYEEAIQYAIKLIPQCSFPQNGEPFFEEQPHSAKDLDKVIRGVLGSEKAGFRYGGKDEEILRRFHRIGEAGLCDLSPSRDYRKVVRNRVQFDYAGNLGHILAHFNKMLANGRPQDVSGVAGTDELFYIMHQPNLEGNTYVYEGEKILDQLFEITISGLQWLSDKETMLKAAELHEKLNRHKRYSKIGWFERDKNDGRAYGKPY